MRRTPAFVFGASLLGACAPGELVLLPQELTISNPEPEAGDHFGFSVAALGRDILVGVPGGDPGGISDSGEVQLINGRTGALLLTIPNPEPEAGDSFGRAVAIEGRVIAVGARGEDISPALLEVGEAYLFDAKTGALLHTLVNPEPDNLDELGEALTFLGRRRIAVSAPQDDVNDQFRAGSVSVFDVRTGEHLYTLTHPVPVAFETTFGAALATLGNDLLVGAPNNPTTGGDVFLFDDVTGALLLHIPNPAPAQGDTFGEAVAALGGDVIVGDPGFAHDGTGEVYLFDGETGALLLSIPNPAPVAGSSFGREVAAVGGDILVGDPTLNGGQGAVYLFDGETGALLLTIPSPSGDANPNLFFGNFGSSLAPLGRGFVVSAPFDDVGAAVDAGAIYTFE